MTSISVVIPLYNKAPHIARALRSVFSQTVQAEEIIVVDDGSTDGGAEIVQQCQDPRIKLIHQENQGVSAARNSGIREAKTSLIAFLDADDAWEVKYLEVICELRKKYPQAGLYATAYWHVNPSGEIHQPEFRVFPPGTRDGLIQDYFQVALYSYPVWTSAVTIPKTILAEIGWFPPVRELTEDDDLWLRIALKYPLAWCKEPLAYYYTDSVNRRAGPGRRRFQGEPIVSQTARKALHSNSVPANVALSLKEYIAGWQLLAAQDCLILGKKDQAITLLRYAQGTHIYRRKWWKLRLLAAMPYNPGPWLWRLKQLLIKNR